MVTRYEVERCFQALLGRSPESEKTIGDHLGLGSVAELCAALVVSEEYQRTLAERFGLRRSLDFADLDQAAQDFEDGQRDRWHETVLRLPDWYDFGLDPDGAQYRAQVLALWSAITGRASYDPRLNEDTPEVGDLDPIYRPGFYSTGDMPFAGAHLMAIGHIVMRSGIGAGSRVLEYGAGFGQTSLALARLGATVDTVDINPAFCRAVDSAAAHYKVALRAHEGSFGFNPAGGSHAYDMILFYESFHHDIDFRANIARYAKLLRPGGKVILAGEPVFREPDASMPYDWGFRLDWENVAVMRRRGWMELGFREAYLFELFAQAGFTPRFFGDANSHWAQVYEFSLPA